jgi:hypothetical protein
LGLINAPIISFTENKNVTFNCVSWYIYSKIEQNNNEKSITHKSSEGQLFVLNVVSCSLLKKMFKAAILTR